MAKEVDSAWARILRQDPCSYCSQVGGTVDHIQPRIRGNPPGKRGTNKAENLTGSCQTCNNDKGTDTIIWIMYKRYDARKRRIEYEQWAKDNQPKQFRVGSVVNNSDWKTWLVTGGL